MLRSQMLKSYRSASVNFTWMEEDKAITFVEKTIQAIPY